jgi:hypothetical protein
VAPREVEVVASFPCARCEVWTDAKVTVLPGRGTKPLTVFCRQCGGMIHSGEVDMSAAGDQSGARAVEARCTVPGCTGLLKGVLAPGKLLRGPCPICGRTVTLGESGDFDPAPSPPGDFFDGVLQQFEDTREYTCLGCGRTWNQTVSGALGSKHTIKCSNSACPQPVETEIVISDEE